MYVCICHAVTDHEIIHKINNGASSMKDLRGTLNVGTTCGRCTICVKDLLKKSLLDTDNGIINAAA